MVTPIVHLVPNVAYSDPTQTLMYSEEQIFYSV